MAQMVSYELKYSLSRGILVVCCFYKVMKFCGLVNTVCYQNLAVLGMQSENLGCVHSGKSLAPLSLRFFLSFFFLIKGRGWAWLMPEGHAESAGHALSAKY